MKIYKFYPKNKAKFRFGDSDGKLNELLSSDQLFSALFNCAVLLYGGDTSANVGAQTLLRLKMSSLNYGLNFTNMLNGKITELFFLPRPFGPIRPPKGVDDLQSHKTAKGISYLSVNAFKLLIDTWRESDMGFEFRLLDLQILGGKFACTKEEARPLGLPGSELNDIKPFAMRTKPKVTVSRVDDASERFYYADEVEINYTQIRDCAIHPFFYFLCEGETNRQFSAVVNLLVEEGVGGKKSSGMGMLGKAVGEDWKDELKTEGSNFYVSLSSIYPTVEEVGHLVYYELVDKKGYLHSQYGRSLRKRRVRLAREGTVLSKDIEGQLLDVRPEGFLEHPVYLDGRAFLVPLGRCKNEI